MLDNDDTPNLDLALDDGAERSAVASTIAGAAASGLTLTDDVLLALDRLARLKVAESARTAGRPAAPEREEISPAAAQADATALTADGPGSPDGDDGFHLRGNHAGSTGPTGGAQLRCPPTDGDGKAKPSPDRRIDRRIDRQSGGSTGASPGVARWRTPPWGSARPLPPDLAGDRVLARVAALSLGRPREGVLEPPVSGPPPSPAEGRKGGPIRPPSADGPPIQLTGESAAIASDDPDDSRRPDAPLGGGRVPPRRDLSDEQRAELERLDFWIDEAVSLDRVRELKRERAELLGETLEPEETEPGSRLTVPTAPPPDGAVVMPPRADGGTRIWIDLKPEDVEAIPAHFARVIEEIRRRQTEDEARASRKEGGRTIKVARRQSSLFEGKSYTASCGASGEDWCRFAFFYVQDMFHVRIEPRSPIKGCVMRVIVECKARLLHSAMDQLPIVDALISEAHWWLTGDDVAPEQLPALGWKTGNVEICVDLYNVPWQRTDAGSFITPSSLMQQGDLSRTFGTDPIFAATVAIGTRSSDMSFVLYNKSRQIAECKGGDASAYAAIWKAYGLAEEHFTLVSRVEFRLKGRALIWEDPETGEILDLRNFRLALDAKVLARVWAMLCERVRLFVPGATRRKRCKTDPRWEKVRAASSAEPRVMKQHREPQEGAHEAAVLRAVRRHLNTAHQIAALHDAKIVDERGYASVAHLALVELGDGNPNLDAELSKRAEVYRSLHLPFMDQEIRAARSVVEDDGGTPLPGLEFYEYEEAS